MAIFQKALLNLSANIGMVVAILQIFAVMERGNQMGAYDCDCITNYEATRREQKRLYEIVYSNKTNGLPAIIHCKDCINWNKYRECCIHPDGLQHCHKDDYCSLAEKR